MLFALSEAVQNQLVSALIDLIKVLIVVLPPTALALVAYFKTRTTAANLMKSDAAFEARLSIHDDTLGRDTKPDGLSASKLAAEKTEVPATPAERTAIATEETARNTERERNRHTPATG